tara:strand:- start:113 stop:367 length:255 start_codon:yes stop_codon:yes gene_type:complete
MKSRHSREIYLVWVKEALDALKGKAKLVDVTKKIWQLHKNEIENMGDLFYTWQYDIGWAAVQLRKNRIMKSTKLSQRGVWELNK